jgi:hypothetical protein
LVPLAQNGSPESHQPWILLEPPKVFSNRSWALVRRNSPFWVALPRSHGWFTTWPGSPNWAMATTWLLTVVLTGATCGPPSSSALPAMTSVTITPISTEEGLVVLRDALATQTTPTVVVVAGRTTGIPTVTVERRELPLQRFTEHVLVAYPGIELITEAQLSTSTDPYLEDHLLEGNALFLRCWAWRR